MLMVWVASSVNQYQLRLITGTERKHGTLAPIKRSIDKVHARLKGHGDGNIEVKDCRIACRSHQKV